MCRYSRQIVTNETQNSKDESAGDILSGPAIQYFLPSDNRLHPSPSILKFNTSAGNEQIFTWLGIQPYSQSGGTSIDDNIAPGFRAVMFRYCLCTGDGTLAHSACVCEPFAVNCSLSPCLKTYHAEIKNGTLNETELSNVKIPNTGNFCGYWLEKALRGGKWSSYSNSMEETPENSVPTLLINETDAAIGYRKGGCFGAFSGYRAVALLDYFANNIWLGDVSSSRNFSGPATATGSAWLLPLFNNGPATMETIIAYIDGLANATTAVIRQYGERPDTMRMSGTTYQNQTCITIQWAWLSLPATPLVLADSFLAAAIWRTGTGGRIIA